jgi:hypothetical protein
LNLNFRFESSYVELVIFNCRTLEMLKIALCGSPAIYVIVNLGHMVEHIPGLADLVLFLANDVSVVHIFDVG